MRKLWLGSMFLAIAVGLFVTHADTLGMKSVWPFVVGLALAPLGAKGRGLIRASLSVTIGVILGVVVFVSVSLWMPWIPMSFGIGAGIAVAIMGTLAAFLPGTFALPPMLIAFGVFYGSYETTWAANRGAFRGDAASAAATVIVCMLGGLIVSLGVSSLLAIQARQRAGEVIPFRARLRVTDSFEERRAAAGGGM
jgi:hypothetical protein